jgi:tRNA dimethylallyltransferase
MNAGGGPVIHILTGPTAVGKTDLALAWAEQHGAEIVSCDSLLFYRGMDVGTAKPEAGQRARVRHHLIDIVEPSDRYDVMRFVQTVRPVLADLLARGRRILVTGGSGFYLGAFFGPVGDDVTVPPEVRAEVVELLAAEGGEGVLKRLLSLNPGGLGALDIQNPRRLTRALERCLASGLGLIELQRRFDALPGPFDSYRKACVRLERPRDVLGERIRLRVSGMIEQGLVPEVVRLREAGFEVNPSACGAIGYRETLAMLDGLLPREDLERTIADNTRRLVRKQETWFRAQLPPHRVVDAASVRPETLFLESDVVPSEG